MKGAANANRDRPQSDEPAFSLSNFHIADEDLPAFRDMKFEDINELHLDHPGANDPNIASGATTLRAWQRSFAKPARSPTSITPKRSKTFGGTSRAGLRSFISSVQPFYLDGKKDLGITNDRIPQLSEMNRRLKETTGFRLAPIEGSGRNACFPVVALVPRDAFDAVHSASFAA